MAPCRARLLSDLTGQTACDQGATSADGRLCAFHSRQCQALYRGYKKRNAELDLQAENPPSCLSKSKISISAFDFDTIGDEATLREVHDHTFKRSNLLDRVIRARKLHHSHFFAIDNDYGHQKYLDQLRNERHVLLKTLEKIGKRAAALMHEKEEWFDWIKKSQEEEETHGDTESKKVKLESLLFKRHQKEIARHLREMKIKENQKRQEEALDAAYTQRLSEMSEEEQDDWDPIQDVYGYEKDNYIDLIKFFLMIKDEETFDGVDDVPALVEVDSAAPAAPAGKVLSKSAKKRARKVNAEEKKMADPSLQTADGRGSSVIEMETKQQMRERLRKPVKFERESGYYFDDVGQFGINATTPVLSDGEIGQLLAEVAEIKNFLFCRLLLSQAALLPVALETDSIEDFLARSEVSREHLRDLCLKLERPSLQNVRDACADFIRERDGIVDEETDDVDDDEDLDGNRTGTKNPYLISMVRDELPTRFHTRREKKAKASKKQNVKADEQGEQGVLDFGRTTDESQYPRTRMRIKVCGHYMYNYRSEKALNRGGWFHFSVIAKDSDLFDAVELCRNWNEFFDLNILCCFHYFPAAKWTKFTGDIRRQLLMQLGFIPYFTGDKAEKVTHYAQTGSRGMARRSHAVVEMRSFVCGHIKRDDPVSRRLIQYLSNETWQLRALVRDRKTGRILIQPPKQEMWLVREKSGWGRASRNEFDVLSEVGATFFEQMDRYRKWHLSFTEYYDVYIWDANPGRPFTMLQRNLEEILARALRVHNVKGMFSATKHILQSVTHDPKTKRVRSIRPDEDVENMWDALDQTARVWSWSPTDGEVVEGFMPSYTYTEADAIEDALLFPEEIDGKMKNNLYRYNPSALDHFERGTIDVRALANDLDTDEEGDYERNGDVWGDPKDDLDDPELGEYARKALDALEDDDGNSDWSTDKTDTDLGTDEDDESLLGPEFITAAEEDAVDQTVDMLSARMKEFKISEPDYFLPILRDPTCAKDIPDAVKKNPANLMGSLRQSLRCLKDYDMSERGMRNDFLRYTDRQKSKIFKEVWHQADLEPGAFKKYGDMLDMIARMDWIVMHEKVDTGPFELAKFMQMAENFRDERRTVDDAFKAYASIALFFETDRFKAHSISGKCRDSLLLNQAERAKHVPDRRTHKSNATMPKQFWKDFDQLLKDNGRDEGDEIQDIFPLVWRKTIRQVVIRLFRAGVICSSYRDSAAGMVTAAQEPHRRHADLYLDYRVGISDVKAVSHLTDPTPLDRDYIIGRLKAFQQNNPDACFSALRLWSAPHFYPLMFSWENRGVCTFLDDRGRLWEFKFIPKDMPYSEWSVHHQLSLRLEPYKKLFGKQVLICKDLIMVMGKDEKDCRLLSAAVTWAVQTRPWRLEIDFWRSFVGVDREFLEGLDSAWLD